MSYLWYCRLQDWREGQSGSASGGFCAWDRKGTRGKGFLFYFTDKPGVNLRDRQARRLIWTVHDTCIQTLVQYTYKVWLVWYRNIPYGFAQIVAELLYLEYPGYYLTSWEINLDEEPETTIVYIILMPAIKQILVLCIALYTRRERSSMRNETANEDLAREFPHGSPDMKHVELITEITSI